MKRRELGPSRRPLIRQAIKLLSNPEFCREARVIHRNTIASVGEVSTTPPDELPAPLLELCTNFGRKWGVAPPLPADLIDPDPRRDYVAAIAAGRWGVVPIFPWTTGREIELAARRIRKALAKQHRDAANTRRAQMARWLETCGFPRHRIAKEVWGRRGGLRRPTTREAIAKTSVDRERELFSQLSDQGLSRGEVERRVYRKLRGSEARASAAVRAAESRYVESLQGLNRDLASPVHTEPVSSAVTSLLRAAFVTEDNSEVWRQLAGLRDALIEPRSE